jgi:hypothetical protein
LLHPACAPWIAHSDDREARKIASMVCTSDAAIDAYLAFGLAEAKALITEHRAAVWAIAEALMIRRTLGSAQIDKHHRERAGTRAPYLLERCSCKRGGIYHWIGNADKIQIKKVTRAVDARRARQRA